MERRYSRQTVVYRSAGTIRSYCTLFRLPNEILYLILDYLQVNDYVHFALAAYVPLRLRIPDVVRFLDASEMDRLRSANHTVILRRNGATISNRSSGPRPNLQSIPPELLFLIWERNLPRRSQVDLALALWAFFCRRGNLTPITDPVIIDDIYRFALLSEGGSY